MTVPAPDVQAALAGRPALLQDACRRALAYLTTWRGRTAMRASVSCWNSTEDDIDRSIAAVHACAK